MTHASVCSFTLVLVLAACGGGGGGDSPTAPSPTSGANQLSIASGDNQSAKAGSELSGPLVVKVASSAGAGLSGVGVTFQVSAGGGTVSPTIAMTDAAGLAQTILKLDQNPGSVTVTVTASTLPNSPVTFTATSRLDFLHVSAGTSYSCGGTTSGNYCWGFNNFGQLGDGTMTSRLTPRYVSAAGGIPLTQIAPVATTACGIISAGGAYCWGANFSGEVGDGTTTQRLTPTAVSMPGASRFTGIGKGTDHTCAVAMGGLAYCWGGNGLAQLGDGTQTQRLTPVAVAQPSSVSFFELGVGDSHSCAIATGGNIYCWGDNAAGQAGVTSPSFVRAPTAVPSPSGMTFITIAIGGDHSCAWSATLALYCWGLNDKGQIGNGNTINQYSPTKVALPQGVTFTRVALGARHTCALTAAGAIYCWGSNANGQLGDGSTTDRLLPSPATTPSGVTLTEISAGATHTCAFGSNAAYCWGSNARGELGDGTTTDRPIPTRVKSQ